MFKAHRVGMSRTGPVQEQIALGVGKFSKAAREARARRFRSMHISAKALSATIRGALDFRVGPGEIR